MKTRFVWVVLNRHLGRTAAFKPGAEASETKSAAFFQMPGCVWGAKAWSTLVLFVVRLSVSVCVPVVFPFTSQGSACWGILFLLLP